MQGGQRAGWRDSENRAASIFAIAAHPTSLSCPVEVSVRALDEPRRRAAVTAIEEEQRSQRAACGDFEDGAAAL